MFTGKAIFNEQQTLFTKIMDILDQCQSWGREGREPGSLANQLPGTEWDRVPPGLDTPREWMGHSWGMTFAWSRRERALRRTSSTSSFPLWFYILDWLPPRKLLWREFRMSIKAIRVHQGGPHSTQTYKEHTVWRYGMFWVLAAVSHNSSISLQCPSSWCWPGKKEGREGKDHLSSSLQREAKWVSPAWTQKFSLTESSALLWSRCLHRQLAFLWHHLGSEWVNQSPWHRVAFNLRQPRQLEGTA